MARSSSYSCKRLKIDMKKALLTIIIALAAGLSAWAGNPAKVENLVRQYKNCDGFEMVSLGRVGTSLIKGAIRLSAENEKDKEAIKVFTNIKRLSIVDFEQVQPEVRARFERKLEKILDGMELIMEVNDDGECVKFYGVEDGTGIQDCIMYSSNGALVITEGGIDLDKMIHLMKLEQ